MAYCKFFYQAKRHHSDYFSRVKTVNPADGASTGTAAATLAAKHSRFFDKGLGSGDSAMDSGHVLQGV
jgi:hypothetical protein